MAQTTVDYEPHIEEAMKLISDGTPRGTVEAELREGVEYYRLPIEDSMRMVVRKHGGSVQSITVDIEFTDLKDAIDPDKEYNVKAVLISSEIVERGSNKDGTTRMVMDGTIVSDSCSKKLLIWEPVKLEINREYILKGCRYSPRFDNLTIRRARDAIMTDADVKIPKTTASLSELDAESNGKDICVIVEDVMEKVSQNGKPYKTILFSDDTGKVLFYDWENRDYSIGDRLMIRKIFIRDKDGRTFFNVGKYSTVTKVD